MRAPSNPKLVQFPSQPQPKHELWTFIKWSLTVIGLLIALAIGVGMGVVIVTTALKTVT